MSDVWVESKVAKYGEYSRWKWTSFAKYEFWKPLQALIVSHRADVSMGEYDSGDRKGVKIGEEESWLDALPPYVHALLPSAGIGTASTFFEGKPTTCWAHCPIGKSRVNHSPSYFETFWKRLEKYFNEFFQESKMGRGRLIFLWFWGSGKITWIVFSLSFSRYRGPKFWFIMLFYWVVICCAFFLFLTYTYF